MWVSPCQSAHTSTLCFLPAPDCFSQWPRGPFSLKGQAAAPQCEQLVAQSVQALTLTTGRKVGQSSLSPHTRSKHQKQRSLLYQLLTHYSINVISSPLISKAAPANAPVPGLPFYCFLSQHPVACQECDATQNGQVLQSLEHVELSPVDIHESQHRCEKTDRAHG